MPDFGYKFLRALVLGLVGAGIVHISILFLLPYFVERTAWTRLAEIAPPLALLRLDADGASTDGFGVADPQFAVAVCRFDTSEAIVQLSAGGKTPFWSISVFNRGGESVFSMNDGDAPDRTLDIAAATQAQLIEVRNATPENFERTAFVQMDAPEGLFVLRAFIPDESWRPAVEAWLAGARCEAR